MGKQPFRFAVIGITAGIARKFAKAISVLNSAGLPCEISVGTSRNLDGAQIVIDDFFQRGWGKEIKLVYSYQDIDFSSVDAVYCCLPTVPRTTCLTYLASRGVPTLGEKMVACDAPAFGSIASLFREHQTPYLENTMFPFSSWFAALKELILSKRVGNIVHIRAHNTFCADDEWLRNDCRTDPSLVPRGCIDDLMHYCSRAILEVVNWEQPVSLRATCHRRWERDGGSVPIHVSAVAEFDSNGRKITAEATTAFCLPLFQMLEVHFDSGYVYQRPWFVLPKAGQETEASLSTATFNLSGYDFALRAESEMIVTPEASHGELTAQEVVLLKAFIEAAQAGTCPPEWISQARLNLEMLDSLSEAIRLT